MRGTSLSRMAANTSGSFSSKVPAEVSREGRGAGGVMSGIQNHLAVDRDAPVLEPAGPGHVCQTIGDSGRRHPNPQGVQKLE